MSLSSPQLAGRTAYLPETAVSQNGMRIIAAIVLFASGVRMQLGHGVTLGLALALVLFPIWLTTLRLYWGARLLMASGALAIASGLFLGPWVASDHVESSTLAIQTVLLFVAALCEVAFILWARTFMSVGSIGLWYGLGIAVKVALFSAGSFSSNPWKFGWAVAVAILALSYVQRYRRRGVEVSVLVILAIVSMFLDSRSYFASFLLAAMLVVWQMRPSRLSRRARWGWTAALIGGVAYGLYLLVSSLMVSGYLGSAVQARSVAEENLTGSLILGGRPEIAATFALIKHVVWGFGPGTIANPNDILIAKTGLANINYDPNNGYVERFMFGPTGIELHSTMGDLWVAYGLAGLLFAAVVVVITVRAIAEGVAHRQASGLLLFLGWWTLWNIFFSPFLSAEPTLVLMLGLGLPLRNAAVSGARPAESG